MSGKITNYDKLNILALILIIIGFSISLYFQFWIGVIVSIGISLIASITAMAIEG